MMRLYLIVRAGEPVLLVCSPPDRIQPVLDEWDGASAYHLGIADPGVPPGAVGEFSGVFPIVMANVRPVARPEEQP